MSDPTEWAFSGYNEIQEPRQRYALIDYNRLLKLLNIETYDQLKDTHKRWVEESLSSGSNIRKSKLTKSIAVGSKNFVEKIKEQLGIRAKGRKILKTDSTYHLREPVAPYNNGFAAQKIKR